MELYQVRELSDRVLDEVEQAVVGKREPLELVFLGFLADGHVLLEDYPGLAKTLAARSFAQVLGIDFARIQFTPDLMPSDVTGSSIWNQRDSRLRVPARADLHEPPPRRRDQPRPAEDAGGAPRGDAGAPGDDRGPHAPARRRRSSSSRRRTRSSTRARIRFPRRSSTASSCARRSAIRAARARSTCSRAASSARADDVVLRTVIDRETLLEMQQAVETVHVVGQRARVLRRPRRGDARPRRAPQSAPVRAAASRSSSSPAAGPRCRGATTSFPTT